MGCKERLLGRTRTLELHASRVRKKLCIAPDDRFVVNVWGVARAVAGVSVDGGKWLSYVVS